MLRNSIIPALPNRRIYRRQAVTVLRAHAHSIRAHVHNIGQRLSRVLIVAVMAALAVAMFASPSRAADQTWSDVSTTINGLIDEGVSTYKAGDAKGGKDKVNDAYYKHYEITGMEKQVMARISGSRVSQVEMEFSLLKKAMSDADSAGVDSHATTLKQYMVEDGASLDGVAPGSAAQASSDDYSPGAWGEVAKTINGILEDGANAYKGGDAKAGKDKVNEAYYKHYEITGMEKQVMSRISGSRVSQVEMEFSLLKKAMSDADSAGVDSHATTLKQYMVEDGASLDGVAPGSAAQASSDDYSPGAWGEVAKTINGILEDGANAYKGGDAKAGKDKVNEAYYKHYEITGMEKQVMSRISGSRVSAVEMEFSLLKKAMTDDDSAAVDQHLSTLTNYIREDANSLDGYTGKAADKTADSSGTSPWIAQFLPSLLVILREGMEAILVVAAVLAYLAKAGHKNKAPIVWGGVALAFGLSIGLAFLFSYVTSLAGANQELLEGFAALFAVAMLIWVSNWMINKSSNKAWDEYIKKQTDASLSSGSLLGLAFISFLAVLREGAETMLFYVPIVAAAGDKVHYVWIGLAVGLVALVIIYLLIQFAAVRIPLRPFFTITSLLMAFMAFTFTGSGIGELQEADVVSLTPISGFPTIDLLGIYPRVENLAAQAIVLVIIVGLYFFGKARLAREAAAQSRAGE